MKKNGVAESADFCVYLQRMYLCEWETEVDYFLWGSQNRRFRVKGMVEKAANDAVEQIYNEYIFANIFMFFHGNTSLIRHR